jgi:hypothetical protein
LVCDPTPPQTAATTMLVFVWFVPSNGHKILLL